MRGGYINRYPLLPSFLQKHADQVVRARFILQMPPWSVLPRATRN
jgi:hypothetical protein